LIENSGSSCRSSTHHGFVGGTREIGEIVPVPKALFQFLEHPKNIEDELYSIELDTKELENMCLKRRTRTEQHPMATLVSWIADTSDLCCGGSQSTLRPFIGYPCTITAGIECCGWKL
jgi:hypothetical protein